MPPVNLLIACLLAVSPFLFAPPQAVADSLTDQEIQQFRTLFKERMIKPSLPGVPTAEDIPKLRGLSESFRGMQFGGYISNYYQYESSNPRAGDSTALSPKAFTTQVNSFTVQNIELWLYKEAPDPGDIGFRITLNWGDIARRITFTRPVYDDGLVAQPMGTAPVPGRTGGRQVTFSEGYAMWNIPVGKGLTVRFGKFSSWMGYEDWESIWNPNFTESYINTDGTPNTATGLGFNYPVTDRFTANYYFKNAFDTFVNNNKSFTHGLELNYNLPDLAFFKNGLITLNTLWGPSQPLNDSRWYQIYDLIIQFSPFKKLTLVTEGDWNLDPTRIAQPSGRLKKDNNGWGVAQYVIYDYTERLGFAVRGEYFWDQDNLCELSGAGGASLVEVTGTLNLKLRERLMIRPEIRYDKIVNFPNGSSHVWNHRNNNITAIIGVSYEF
ncbi:MAG TPA: hypothetical protein DIS73_02095 [Planctomycetia bacterium]|nr:hypothetical protein [Planctomycetia bacterium]